MGLPLPNRQVSRRRANCTVVSAGPGPSVQFKAKVRMSPGRLPLFLRALSEEPSPAPGAVLYSTNRSLRDFSPTKPVSNTAA